MAAVLAYFAVSAFVLMRLLSRRRLRVQRQLWRDQFDPEAVWDDERGLFVRGR
jgi:hypothetical protein